MSQHSDHEKSRKPFTPGWHHEVETSFGLPIKKAGKVVPVKKVINHPKAESDESEDDDDHEESIIESVGAPKSDFDDFDNGSNSRFKKSINGHDSKSIDEIKLHISQICTFTCADPHTSLKRKPIQTHSVDNDNEDNDEIDETNIRLIDLFEYVDHPDTQVVQMAILSLLLVFKDILPGYQIRSTNTIDKDVIYKKETKMIMDYEQALLRAYERYLNILENRIERGLGNYKQEIKDSNNIYSILGYHALKCQCELLLNSPYFNHRDKLIHSIVCRAIQPTMSISTLCCQYLQKTVEKDVEAECTYMIIRKIANILISVKHDVSGHILYVLDKVKIRIHEDDAKVLRTQAKKEKRKRKRSNDDTEARMLEAESLNPLNVKRAQADCLREMCLIYFRILKQKIGFKLLPIALEGLAKLTHLINMDTVMDLLSLLKSFLLSPTIHLPLEIKVHCIYCALRTLSGPGQELEIDDEIYVTQLCTLLKELPSMSRWDLVFDCIDLCLLQKRETKKVVIYDIITSLFMRLSHLEPMTGISCLGLLHNVMVHYPTIRNEILVQLQTLNSSHTSSNGNNSNAINNYEVEDVVEDIAMNGLLKKKSTNPSTMIQAMTSEHIFWNISLCKHSMDIHYKEIISLLNGTNIMPIDYKKQYGNTAESHYLEQVFIPYLDYSLDTLKSKDTNTYHHKSNKSSHVSNSASSVNNNMKNIISHSSNNKKQKKENDQSKPAVTTKIDYRSKKSNHNFNRDKKKGNSNSSKSNSGGGGKNAAATTKGKMSKNNLKFSNNGENKSSNYSNNKKSGHKNSSQGNRRR